MLLKEWNQEEAIAVRCEEAREEAREEQREECNAEHQQQMRELFASLESGVSIAEAKKKMGLS